MHYKIKEFIKNSEVSSKVKELISNYKFNSVDHVYKHDNDTVAIISTFSDLSSGGGVARDSILTVFHKQKIREGKWRYSDKWSHRNDRRDLMLLEVKKVSIETEGDETQITITCAGGLDYPDRVISFDF